LLLRHTPIRALRGLIAAVIVAVSMLLPAAGTARAVTASQPGPGPVASGTRATVSTEADYNAFPEGLMLPDGTIRVTYTHAAYHAGPAASLMRTSTDGGQTWSAPVQVGTLRSPVRLPSGVVVAASMAPMGATRGAATSRSVNGGASWNLDGLAAGGGGFTGEAAPFSLVLLNDGSLLMSVSGVDATGDTSSYVRYLRSTDEGRTWQIRATIRDSGRPYSEPTLAVAPDGTIVSAMRADNGNTDGTIYFTESEDSGATWTSRHAVFQHASGEPRLAFLADGSLVAMYRSIWTDFHPFRYARSLDEGRSWTYGLDFTGEWQRSMMGGAWILGPDRSVRGVVYALEDDWYHASVYYRALSVPTSATEVRSMTRAYILDANGTSARVTGRVATVTSSGTETPTAGAAVEFTLRSYDPATGATVVDKPLTTKTDASGSFSATVPVARHGELVLHVAGMPASASYAVGTFRSSPGFSSCPAAQVARSGMTYFLYCVAHPASGLGGEFQRWNGSAWVHQKSAWADSAGLFETPISISAATRYRLTIWQTRWTDRVYGPTITVTIGSSETTRYTSPAPGTYVPVSPTRILDTRAANGLSGAFQSGKPRSFLVAGRAGVPAGATAVTGNLTVTGQSSPGYLAVGPLNPGGAPSTSTLNFPVGDDRANGVTVPLSADGRLFVTFMGRAGATAEAIFDVTGYFVADATGATFVPVSPARLVDTRSATGIGRSLVAGTPATFQVTGRGNVPNDAVAVTGNLTVTQQSASGYVSLTPEPPGTTPSTSTLNFPLGDNRANNVTVRLGSGGTLTATYSSRAGAVTHFIFDVTGYFVADSRGARFVPIDPIRILDTRTATGLSSALASGVSRAFLVAGAGTVPATAVGVTGNLTVTGQTSLGYVALTPTIPGSTPTTSTINFPVGDNRANGVVTPTDNTGRLAATFVGAAGSSTDLILDITGYFIP
jgi:hypothetical protein